MFAKKFNSWFIQIIFFIEGSCNRPYLCGDFLLLLRQMFMMLFIPYFHAFCFFLWGKQLVFFLWATALIVLIWAFCSGERDILYFLWLTASFLNTWPLWSGERDLQCFFSAVAFFLSNKPLSSGERDSRFLLCASASVSKILIFFSGGRESPCVLCASALLHNIWVFSLMREIVDSFVVQQHLWLKSVLSYWERETLNIASPLQNSFSNFVGRNIQHVFWF